MTTETIKNYTGVWEIERDCERAGNVWFSAGAMGFFNTRLCQEVYGGKYFVTSERFNFSSKRLYTVREVRYVDGKISIDTVGQFQGYTTRYRAVKAIQELLKGVK